MTLEEIVKGKEIPIIEYRFFADVPGYGQIDTLFGYCAYENGKLKSLDGDTYYLNAEIEKYEWYTDSKKQRVLCVWESTEFNL